MPIVPRLLLLAAILFCGMLSQAQADTLRVLTAGAFKPVVQAVVSDFERQTGSKVQIANDTAGNLIKRVEQGEPFDVIVLTNVALQTLDAKHFLVPQSSVDLARVGVGVAVKHGAPHPALGSEADFVAALKSARQVAYIDPASGGSSGIYLHELFRKMDLASTLAGKSVLVRGGLVAEKLVTGEADLAIHQISEILAVPGVDLVGPLPPSIQNYTVYAGAIARAADKADLAQSFLSALKSPSAIKFMAGKGLEPAPGF